LVVLIPERIKVPENAQVTAVFGCEVKSIRILCLLNGTGIPSLCLLGIRGNINESTLNHLGINAKELWPEEPL